VVWFVQDLAKVLCYKVLLRYNIFGIKDTKVRPVANDSTGSNVTEAKDSKPTAIVVHQ